MAWISTTRCATEHAQSYKKKISLKNTGTKHVPYADDLIGAGDIKALRKWWDNITQHGPPLGYKPNAAKSSLIVKNEHKELAENIFEGTNVIIRTDGAKHLGAVIGTSDYKETFIKNLVSQGAKELRQLTKIARTEPQAAYSNFTHSLRQKWNFTIRTIPGLENYLLPLEKVISKKFLPDLLRCPIKQEI